MRSIELFISKIIFLLTCLISQIKTIEEYDISRGQSIRMSNSYGIIENGDAINCLDRDVNTVCRASYYHDYQSPSHALSGAWLQIDLKGIYNISKIITCAPDNKDSVFSGAFDIYVRMNNSLILDEDVQINLNYIPKNNCFNFTKYQGFLGQFVTFKKNDIRIIDDLANLVFSELIIITERPEYEIINLKNAIQNTFEKTSDSRPSERGERRRIPAHIFFHDVPLDQSYHASNVVDGKVETCNFDGDLYTFVLHLDTQPKNESGWWSVDLGDVYEVYSVQIENTGRRSNRFTNTKIDIYLSMDRDAVDEFNSTRQLCYSMDNNTFTIGHNSIFNCLPNVSGKYLTIKKTGGNKPNVLYLCEVSVYIRHKAQPFELSRVIFKENSYTSASPSTAVSTRVETSTMTSTTRVFRSCPRCKKPEDCSNLRTEKVIIGVVVAILAFIIGNFSGFFVAIKKYNMDKIIEPPQSKNVFFNREMRSQDGNINY